MYYRAMSDNSPFWVWPRHPGWIWSGRKSKVTSVTLILLMLVPFTERAEAG